MRITDTADAPVTESSPAAAAATAADSPAASARAESPRPLPAGRHALRAPALLREHGWAVAGYCFLTALFFWPLFAQFGGFFLASPGDGPHALWTFWNTPRVVGELLHGHLQNPFHSSLVYAPVGAYLGFGTGTWLEALLTWPLTQLIGLALAANVMQIVAIVSSGVTAYALAYHACHDRRAAFLAGVGFMLAPYRYAHASAVNLNHTEFLPLGLLALLLLYERPTRRRALLFGGIVGATFLTDFYYSEFLLGAAAIVAAWHWRQTFTPPMLRRLAQAAALAGLIALPLGLELAHEVRSGELDPLPGWGQSDTFSADLLAYVAPYSAYRFLGEHSPLLPAPPKSEENVAYPGILILALAVLAACTSKAPRKGLWVALAAVFGVLSLGPFLQVDGHSGSLFHYLGAHFSLPLPYFLLHFVPVVNGVRVAARFSVVAMLALDVLAALALARFGRRWRTAGTLVLALTLFDFLPLGPLQFMPTAIPPAYAAVAADSDRGAVLELPLQWRDAFTIVGDSSPERNDSLFMYFATRHGKPTVGGYLARLPRKRFDRLTTEPAFRQALALEHEPGYTDPPTFGAADLRRLGIGFVVYHRDYPEPDALAYIQSLHLSLLADDGTVLVWKLP